MDTQTVHALFEDHHAADRAYRALRAAGFDPDDISLLAREAALSAVYDRKTSAGEAAEGAGLGALAGGATGGILGVLAGLGAIVIPGLGPVLATGTVAAALASAAGGAGVGAAVGGILGAAMSLAIPEADAHVYAEGVKQGGVLVVAQVADGRAGEVQAILEQNGALDTDRLQSAWKAHGWDGYSAEEETTLPLTLGDLEEDARQRR